MQHFLLFSLALQELCKHAISPKYFIYTEQTENGALIIFHFNSLLGRCDLLYNIIDYFVFRFNVH